MQFFAYDKNRIIFSEDAIKGQDYRCPECHGRLHVKQGFYRRKHFFHLYFSTNCNQNKKSLVHLTIQKKIMQSLPQGETSIEKHFSSIHRIADVVWEPKKLIFEVQCSPITLEEVKSRMKDYASVGYKVIWILHDHRFNRKKLSAAEHYLRPSDAFFTSINQKGKGIFYDQHEVFSLGKRVRKGRPYRIDLSNPVKKRLSPPPKPPFLYQRLKDWICFFYYLVLKQASN